MPRRAPVVPCRVHRRSCLLTLLCLGCHRGSADRPATVEPAPTPAITRPPYRALVERIEESRLELAERWSRAADDARKPIEAEARATMQRMLTEILLPAWMGTRWSFNGTSTEPLGPSGIACGYFVVTVLQHLGLQIESRRRFAQSTARTIARSLVPDGPSHHRVFSVTAPVLEKTVRSFGEGVHLLGLDVHVGFVVVKPDAVRVVHASYLNPRTVVDEPITASGAIEHSRQAGYHVTNLFAGETLVRAWLSQTPLPLVSS